MIIGVPKEIKSHEYRVGLVPASVKELKIHGHQIIVEKNAGKGVGFLDSDYELQGAKVLETAKEIYEKADMIVKVKEPQVAEYTLLRENQILFTYLHLAADHEQTSALLQARCIGIAYETVTSDRKTLPLLAPMSEVAGRMSIQVAATALQKYNGGSGILLSGVPGVSPGKVLIIGGGVAGFNAALMAMGMGSKVTIIDKDIERLRQLDTQFGKQIETIYSTVHAIETFVANADVVIGAVLVPGDAAPKLVTSKMLSNMRPGSVMVDIAIDQGGCFETSRPTTHDNPTYIVDGIVHYCVTNMPSSVARSSAFALNNATLPYVLAIANKDYKQALLADKHFMNGLNVCKGKVTHEAVAKHLKLDYINPLSILE